MVIVVAGAIGCGKSSLATLLADYYGSEAYFESVDDNPILPLFYTASEEVTYHYVSLLRHQMNI